MATKHQKDTENLVFGAYTGTIYRRTDLKHSSYFLRVFIKEEGKYIRRSLQTDDAVQARKAATEHIIQIFTKVESGQRVISISLAELKRKFWIHREALVAQGQVSKNTLDNHATRINHGMRFLDSKAKGIHTLISSLEVHPGVSGLYRRHRLGSKGRIRSSVEQVESRLLHCNLDGYNLGGDRRTRSVSVCPPTFPTPFAG